MFKDPLPALVNHRKLAQDNRQLGGSIALSQFKRLVECLESSTGSVRVDLSFKSGRKRKTQIVGKVNGVVTLLCQRCLAPMQFELNVQIRHFVVPNDDALQTLLEHEDGIVITQDKVMLVDLLEDELIVCLPMASRHAIAEAGNECQMVAEHKNDETPVTDTHKPFAGLAGFIKE
ncbi:MAG: DUF177 domain-containing protein [Pseudomonadales bacterium]|nr:DUF177 domain-containing protein [Pseudomonadales bacterium]